MVLQVDGAAGGGGRQVDLVLVESLLVLRHPVAEHVGVVCGYDGHFCNNITIYNTTIGMVFALYYN